MNIETRIAPCLWFDHQAEEAARQYVDIFPGSRIIGTSRYTEAGREFHRHEPGAVLTVEFELAGQGFTALNGGPLFTFSEAVSFQVMCDTQEEIDHYWERLSEGGTAGSCGWLKDRFGVSWQVVPKVMQAILLGGDAQRAERAMQAMFGMGKLDLAVLERA